MSRWRYDKKNTVESCKSISTTFLKKHGYFPQALTNKVSIKDPSNTVDPSVKKVVDKLRRWIHDNYQSSVSTGSFQSLLDEFSFRQDRTLTRGQAFLWLMELAMKTTPNAGKKKNKEASPGRVAR